MNRPFVIVGAGQAGSWIARTLRSEGYDGTIILIGSERHHPYERPPLSKSVLATGSGIAEATLLDAALADALGVECLLGETVVSIDRARQQVLCRSGRRVRYDRLFLTTGATPRHIPGAMADGRRLHQLRTFDDASRLAQAWPDMRRLAILGGGWIGLEVAATARQQGIEVVLVEAAPRLCARSVPPVVSDYLARLHAGEGVDVRLGAAARTIHADDARVAMELADHDTVIADHLVIGIGAVPETGLAQACGLTVEDGVVVDACGRTSDPAIFAAGDVTSQPCAWTGERVRRESWQNAQNQAIVAAKACLGHDVAHTDVPWLWSDQYDRNMQLLGYPDRGVTCAERATPGTGAGSWLFMDNDGRAIGAVSINAARDLRPVRQAIAARQGIDLAKWGDPAIPAQAIPLVVR